MTNDEVLKEGHTILVDKPLHWTSFDVVNKIRTIIKYEFGIPKIKVGHAGTLDPLATGLLIICIGRHTKRIEHYQDLHKEYVGQIYLGATTPSYDLETEVDATFPVNHITNESIQHVVEQFTGEFLQYPPIFSAIKQKGKPIYKKARMGVDVKVNPRLVEIFKFEWNRDQDCIISFTVQCSKGTYIRSLAHDLGKGLQSGAYLQELRRTAIGKYSVDQAMQMEEVPEKLSKIIAMYDHSA